MIWSSIRLSRHEQELYRDVCKLANAMKAQGVKKGDIVMIYMPMVRALNLSCSCLPTCQRFCCSSK